MLKILVLTWNAEDKLRKLCPSLINSLKNIDYEIFFKDNASTDNSIEYLKSLNNDRIKVMAYKNNLQNFSQGCNLLFKEADPQDEDYIMLLNNDIIFNDTTSIDKLIKIMEKDKNVGVVGAKLLWTNTNKLQHAGVVFNFSIQAPSHFRLGEETDDDSKKNRQFQVVTGAVLLTKAKYYKEVYDDKKSGNKGLNINYVWGFDDVDLCLEIKYSMEKKIVYCGDTNIYHEDSGSLKKVPTNRLFLTHNLNYLRNKWSKRICYDKEMYEINHNFNLYNG